LASGDSSAAALRLALAERVTTLVHAQERLEALEAGPVGAPAPERELAEAVLRRALGCLSGASEYQLAAGLLGAGRLAGVAAGADDSLQAISQAGLASWDPSTNELSPTALLAALMGIFEAALKTPPAPLPR